MRFARLMAAVLILLAFPPAASPQGQLVVTTATTKQYHRPSCPVVRDRKDVVAMTAGQAEARGYKSHPQCERAANAPADPAKPQPAVFVYTVKGDTRYHREDCKKLPSERERRKLALEEAGKKLWPCPVCRPPIRKRTPAIRNDAAVLECVIFVGLPASGKTTFYQRRFAATHRHISKDHWPNASRKDARQAELIRQALGAGESVVVDNTNPAPADRTQVIALARELGARVIGYHFSATTREAVGRNRGREGHRRVPDVAIFTKAKRMVPPTAAEGFDELYRVAIRKDGEYDVTAAS